MFIRTSTALVGGLAATCLAGGVAVAALAAGATAGATAPDPAPRRVASVTTHETQPAPGMASTSAPYVQGVPHVPDDVLLVLGPGGSADGMRYVGPPGSLFNGPVDVVDRRVDAWWADQMAAGVSPEEADRRLAHPQG